MNLPSLQDRPRCARQKWETKSRLDEREATKKDEKRKGEVFRAKVWKRAKNSCEVCGRKVRHTIELVPEAGHVDHNRGRNVAPEDRFNPKAAKLKCGRCRLKRHGQNL